MRKSSIIALAVAMVLTAGAISGCGCSKDNEAPQATSSTQATSAPQKATMKEMPTFMYYVSSSDENFDKTNEIVEELKKEYEGKVQFKIINIDEAADASQLLVSKGQTPTLIMTGKTNETEIKSKCNNKDELKQCIENAIK